MSDIKLRGYVNHGKSKTAKASGKTFSTFSVSETNKDKKTGQKSYTFYEVTDFEHAAPPADGSYVNVGGYLKVRKYVDNEGKDKVSLDVVCQNLEISPPRDQVPAAEATQDPFEF